MSHARDDANLDIPASAASPAPLAAVESRADLAVGAVLGRGGAGTVRAATVPDAGGRPVAVKEPHERAAVAPAVAERFRVEAATWSDLAGHDHVVTVHGYGTDPRPWIAMERVTGGSLADRTGAVGTAQALWTGACVAAALDHAHRQGVAHLDLTPSNVLVRTPPDDGWPVPAVSDWGAARTLGEDATIAALSPRYAAPEQFAPDRFGGPGPATDVYQVAAVVYALLAGAPPFGGPPSAVQTAVLEESPPPVSGRVPGVPTAVDDVLGRALATAPGDRYDSMYAFRGALTALLADHVGADPGASLAGARETAVAQEPPRGDPAVVAPATDGPPPVDGTTTDTGAPDEGGSTPYERAVTLAEEGFVRLSEAYFARRDPAPPLRAWQRGVRLVDARAGRAVERTVEADGERVSLVDRLLAGLRDGTGHVVVGPPGSGKSTVCRRVACEWFDAGHGPVFYRESGGDGRFERPGALVRQASAAEGHALVVVEDAVRPAARAVFELHERVADAGDVTVLLDARRGEWHDAGDPGPFGRDPVAAARDRLEVMELPRPDATEHERFVEAVADAADGGLDVDVDDLRTAVRRAAAVGDDDERRPGELFYLLHRLTARAREPLSGTDSPTSLTEAVAALYDELADNGEAALDVGVCANLCNTAGLGVRPSLLHAVAPDAPLAVETAVDALAGRVVFPREADRPGVDEGYPAVHEAWSTAFLTHWLETAGEAAARERFERVAGRLLALADDGAARERVAGALDGQSAFLARVADDPTAWADETVRALVRAARERPKLAPLFGDGASSGMPVPAACSPAVRERLPAWLGEAFLRGGHHDRAERAFERLPTDGPAGVERQLGRARVAHQRGAFDEAVTAAEASLAWVLDTDRPVVEARARLVLGTALAGRTDYDAAREQLTAALAAFEANDEPRWLVRTLDRLGEIAREQGAHDDAVGYLQRGVELADQLGDRRAAAASRSAIGAVRLVQGAFDDAEHQLEHGLEAAREVGDRPAVATTLKRLAVLYSNRGAYDRAAEHYRRSLSLYREMGDRNGVASVLGNLGLLHERRGAFERARERLRRSLDVHRELGDSHGAATRLNNLGLVAIRQGALERGRDRFEAGLDLARELEVPRREVNALNGLGHVARLQGHYGDARGHHRQALSVADVVDLRRRAADSRNKLGLVFRRLGEPATAATHHEAALELARDLEHPREAAKALAGLGVLAHRDGDPDTGRERLAAALDRIAATDNGAETAQIRLVGARLALERGDVASAAADARTVHAACTEMGATVWVGRSRRLIGRMALARDQPLAARAHWRAALAAAATAGAPQDALVALEHLVTEATGAGATGRAERWRAVARGWLADAPPPVAGRHRDWVTAGELAADGGDG